MRPKLHRRSSANRAADGWAGGPASNDAEPSHFQDGVVRRWRALPSGAPGVGDVPRTALLPFFQRTEVPTGCPCHAQEYAEYHPEPGRCRAGVGRAAGCTLRVLRGTLRCMLLAATRQRPAVARGGNPRAHGNAEQQYSPATAWSGSGGTLRRASRVARGCARWQAVPSCAGAQCPPTDLTGRRLGYHEPCSSRA